MKKCESGPFGTGIGALQSPVPTPQNPTYTPTNPDVNASPLSDLVPRSYFYISGSPWNSFGNSVPQNPYADGVGGVEFSDGFGYAAGDTADAGATYYPLPFHAPTTAVGLGGGWAFLNDCAPIVRSTDTVNSVAVKFRMRTTGGLAGFKQRIEVSVSKHGDSPITGELVNVSSGWAEYTVSSSWGYGSWTASEVNGLNIWFRRPGYDGPELGWLPPPGAPDPDMRSVRELDYAIAVVSHTGYGNLPDDAFAPPSDLV